MSTRTRPSSVSNAVTFAKAATNALRSPISASSPHWRSGCCVAVSISPRHNGSASSRIRRLPRSRRCAPGRSGPARCVAGRPGTLAHVHPTSDVDGRAEREDLGEGGDRGVVHADAPVADAVTERGRVVVAVDADLAVAAVEVGQHVGVARQAVRERPVDGVGVGGLLQHADEVAAGRRRRRGRTGRDRTLVVDTRTVVDGDLVRRQRHDDPVRVHHELDVGGVHPAGAAVRADRQQDLHPAVGLHRLGQEHLRDRVAAVVVDEPRVRERARRRRRAGLVVHLQHGHLHLGDAAAVRWEGRRRRGGGSDDRSARGRGGALFVAAATARRGAERERHEDGADRDHQPAPDAHRGQDAAMEAPSRTSWRVAEPRLSSIAFDHWK